MKMVGGVFFSTLFMGGKRGAQETGVTVGNFRFSRNVFRGILREP